MLAVSGLTLRVGITIYFDVDKIKRQSVVTFNRAFHFTAVMRFLTKTRLFRAFSRETLHFEAGRRTHDLIHPADCR